MTPVFQNIVARTLDGKGSLGDEGLSGSLVRVGSVPKLHPLDTGARLDLSSEGGILLPKVVGDGGVVVGGLLERLEGESSLGVLTDGTRLPPLGKDGVVVGRGREDGHSAVVLGRSSEEGNTSNVDLLNGGGEGAVGLGRLKDEGVEVAGDDGDGSDRVGSKVGQVGRDVSRKDTWGGRRPTSDQEGVLGGLKQMI